MKRKNDKKNPRGKTAKVSSVDKKMTFSEIMQKNPGAALILMESGMHCIGCHLSASETLEQGAIMHGIDPDKLVAKINKHINKEGKKK